MRPTSSPSRRGTARRLAGGTLATAVVLLAVSGLMGATAGRATATTTPTGTGGASPYTITLAQSSGLSDGQPVPYSVTSSDPAKDPVGWVDAELCEPKIDYSSYAVVRTRGNCGFSPGSSAYTSPNGDATQDYPGEPSGASSFPHDFVMGVGTATLYNTFTLDCDSTHPCDLVITVFDNQTQFNEELGGVVKAFPLTFLPTGAVDGCKGLATAAIQTVSSDRLTQAYEGWSKQACTEGGPGAGLAPTQDTFVDEGGTFGAVDDFSSGNADLAYAAGGYDLPGFTEKEGRPYVAVPIAINAVVVSSSGGQVVPAYTPKHTIPVTSTSPYTKLELTAGQAASLFGGGYLSTAEAKAVYKENPVLKPAPVLVPYSPPGTSTFIYPQAVAGTDATTVFASTYFTDLAKSDWNSGPNAPQGTPANVQRGIISAFATPGGKEPDFTSLSLYSHRTDLERSALPFLGQGPDPLWVLTDRATATELGFTSASLDSGTGTTYVAPTEATMDAAVADMTPQKDGTLVPDPAKAAASKTPAYPLTFIEYALAPTEPLVTASCKPRTGSEQLLIQWLKFLTGKGQSNMAAGLEPLTSSLQAQAAAAIAKIGTATATGKCAPPASTTTTTTTTVPGSSDGTFPSGSTPSDGAGGGTGATTSSGTGGGGSTSAKTSPTVHDVNKTGRTHKTSSTGPQQLASAKIPKLGGSRPTGWLVPSIALLLLGLLTGGMALRASGRSPIAAVAALGRRLGGRGPGGAS